MQSFTRIKPNNEARGPPTVKNKLDSYDQYLYIADAFKQSKKSIVDPKNNCYMFNLPTCAVAEPVQVPVPRMQK